MAHMYYKGVALNNPSNDTLGINLGNENRMFLKIKHLEDGFIHLASVEIQKRKYLECDPDKRNIELFLHSGDSFNISFVNELIVISITDAAYGNIDLLTIDTKNKKLVYWTNKEEDF